MMQRTYVDNRRAKGQADNCPVAVPYDPKSVDLVSIESEPFNAYNVKIDHYIVTNCVLHDM